MPAPIQRPTFHEDQVLGADDLNHEVDYQRSQRARHLRSHHSWGIVDGLALETSPRTTELGLPYVEVTVAPGLAVDPSGRAIVLEGRTSVDGDLFDQMNVATSDPDAWYPVFLHGRDEEARASHAPEQACASGAATRIAEAYAIAFGRPGDEHDLDDQPHVAPGDGPGGAPGGPTWRVLLGFVRWDSSIARFTTARHHSDGIERRHAGVRAAEVVAPAGRVVVRGAPIGADGMPALAVTAGDEPLLSFGPQTAAGAITPVMTVDTSGNLTVTGKIVGALAGGVQVESGVATDGMLLPLPTGITARQIENEEVVIQAHIAPRFVAPLDFNPDERWVAGVLECRLVGRRVACRFRWMRTDGTFGGEDRPGACDYVLMAFPRDASEGGP